MTGTPEEEVGYLASDEYTNRLASPSAELSHDSQPAVESPLRNVSVPVSEHENKRETPAQTPGEQEGQHDRGVIHVDEPYHQLHHPDGFAPNPSFETQSRELADDDVENEPILAADEIRPESAFQHPAVSPTFDMRDSAEHEGRSRTPSASHSHTDSRSTSHHGNLPTTARHPPRGEFEDAHTPLEDVAEYEPLFPEDDTREKKPIPATERFKQRPEMLKHRFPSEDIWEDSPSSLQLHATVTTPDLTKEGTFESPEQEAARKRETDHVDPHEVASNVFESEDRHEKAPLRPELTKQRFPSRDIWEDAPDSQQLVTTIEHPQTENKSPVAARSPDVPAKPSLPTRPQRRPQQAPPVDTSTKPAISPTEKRQPPVVSEKPKPHIPIRPAKPISSDSSESPPKATSPGQASGGEETKEAPAVPSTKPKPPVPARPGGSKIAALKAGFLSDLNSRLQVGPQGPKPQEKKEEKPPAPKGPLNDARKGRARGPARRKPAAENAAPKLPTIPELRITDTWSVWQFNEDGELIVGGESKANKQVDREPVATDSLSSHDAMAPELAKSTAGEPADPKLAPEKEKVAKSEIIKPEPESEPTAPSEPADTASTATEMPSPITSPVEEKVTAPSTRSSLAEEKPEAVPAEEKMETASSPTTLPVEGKPGAAPAVEPAALPQPDVEEPFRPPPDTKVDTGAPPTAQLDDGVEDIATAADEREHRTVV